MICKGKLWSWTMMTVVTMRRFGGQAITATQTSETLTIFGYVAFAHQDGMADSALDEVWLLH